MFHVGFTPSPITDLALGVEGDDLPAPFPIIVHHPLADRPAFETEADRDARSANAKRQPPSTTDDLFGQKSRHRLVTSGLYSSGLRLLACFLISLSLITQSPLLMSIRGSC